jgi:glycosyltransferase involved in cell wall biosynthesis
MTGRAMTGRARVGINLLWLVPGVVGGSEEYATRLIGAMAQEEPDDLELVLFALAPFVEAHPELTRRCETVTLPISGRSKVARVVAESTWLALQVRRRRIALVHHLGGRMPAVSSGPSLVTVHDLQPLEHPENFSPVKRMFLRRALPRSVARAGVVVAPSDHVRRSIVARFGLPDERTAVVSAPVARHEATTTDPGELPDELSGVLRSGAPLFVYPAITYRHKNHAVLIEAFASLVREHPGAKLVLTGGAGEAEAEVRDLIAARGLGDAVLRPGRVERPVLDALLAGATALVFPSRFEGFGLPVLEAMAVGCPVIVSDATALPEVVGGAGALVAPDDVEGWRRAMASAVVAPRGEVVAAGKARAAAYTGHEMATRQLAVYRAMLEAGGRDDAVTSSTG